MVGFEKESAVSFDSVGKVKVSWAHRGRCAKIENYSTAQFCGTLL